MTLLSKGTTDYSIHQFGQFIEKRAWF